jgi:phosphoenolpyruvate synthase/pyruvate phosphate dikinase
MLKRRQFMAYVLDFQDVDRTHVALVGGKGAHLGELARIDGVSVPPGFCVTADAYERMIAKVSSLDEQLDRLSRLEWRGREDREAIRAVSLGLRETIEATTIPSDIVSEITRALARLGERAAYAVRSSASAEDLPTASFAGQHDTYLNVAGPIAILEHVRWCWASLFTERAMTYRIRNGFDHRNVRMGVVVQQMVLPRAAGTLFTADPVTGNRKVASIEASFGLGEALVSGLVNGDVYKVRGGEIVAKTVATKQLAILASPAGGTQERAIELERQTQPALTDAQLVRLAQIGRRIEAHFGQPQDIEWCLAEVHFQIVQSRPITTLFPIPAAGDDENHVYLSVGHQQMMTDAMKPLGISVRQMLNPMHEAGGRLFVDVTRILTSPTRRSGLLDILGERSDPLIRGALQTILDRGDFIRPLPGETSEGHGHAPPGGAPAPIETDPAIPAELIARSEASIAAAKREIRTKSGSELLDFIMTDIQELKRLLFDPRSSQVFMTAMEATWWINEHLEMWLGEKNVADTLTQSAPNNVTSEMGLALLDVADAIRPHLEVVAFLRQVRDDDFIETLPKLAGGTEARDAIQGWLDKYGMRGPGEMDITRPRWSERPTMLLPILLGHIDNFEPGEAKRRFEHARREAWQKEKEVIERLRALPDGQRKADETKRMIDRVRTFIGYREYPKYGMVSRYFIYKQALLQEAARLVEAGVLRQTEDIFYLSLQETHDVVRAHQVDEILIRRRKDEFRSYQALVPPRVLTSDGESVPGAYQRDDVPVGALVGLAASAGTVEGRARVVLDMAAADLEAGDILVTTFTDPGWTPLFVTITGLVTEVGGLMTHGAVIAREYGLPAIVGVENATRLIRDGQRIRVHGTEGYVEILSEVADDVVRGSVAR